MSDLPEIPEAEAGPELQAIYAELKATAGTAMVNLIYRHIATIPDALPWVWTTIRSGVGYERIEPAARRLSPPAFGRPLPPDAFALFGIGENEARAGARVIAAYNDANALNLVTLTALRRILDAVGDGPATTFSPAERTSPPRPSRGTIPPIVPQADMAPETLALVRRLSRIGDDQGAGDGVLPSLYRNLAHWPAWLALALVALEPLDAAGVLVAARREAAASAATAARPLVDHALARGVDPVPPGVRAPLGAALDVFTGRIIPKMLPVGHSLIALTPEAWRPPAPSRATAG